MVSEGRNLMLYIPGDGTYGTTANMYPIACDTSCTLSGAAEMLETSTKDNGIWKTFLPTLLDYKISGTGLVDFSKTMNILFIQAYLTGRKAIAWKMIQAADNGDSGEVIWSGTGYFTQITKTGNVKDATQFQYAIQVTGQIAISNSFVSGGASQPPVENTKQMYTLEFTATAGQTSYNDPALVGADLVLFSLSNYVIYSQSGPNTGTFNPATGTITWNTAATAGAGALIIYQK